MSDEPSYAMYQNDLTRAKRAVRKTLEKVQSAKAKLAEATADLRRRNTLSRIPRDRLDEEEQAFFARLDGNLPISILFNYLIKLWLPIFRPR